jgi:hypothetical protein
MDVATTGAGNCQHDGVLCNGCGSCCSRNCGPWALTGVDVCQPGLGCKILNSLCTTSAECCGGDTGTVTCNPATGGSLSIGVCANHGNQVPAYAASRRRRRSTPRRCRCRRRGATHPTRSGCRAAWAPAPAATAVPGSSRGRPVAAGRPEDGTGRVRNLVPCVPDATGVRHVCLPPNDGGIVCVARAAPARRPTVTGYVATSRREPWHLRQPAQLRRRHADLRPVRQGCGGAPPAATAPVCTYSPTNTACAGQTGACLIPIN